MSIDNRVITEDSPRRFVTTLQRQLIRENPSALPLHGIDGEYGPETEDWVRRFQERKGLTVDGIAGPETLGRLRDDIIYRPGDSGNGVELLQEDLMYFTVDLSPYGADGDYGGITEQGVKDFQFFNSLVVDGVAGPDTFYKIDELYETILIQQEDEGALVRRIQTQLNEQEEVNLSISVDGIYGSETVGAVEQFQEAVDLYVDGIVGPRTLVALDVEAIQPFTEEENAEVLEEIGYVVEDLSTNRTNELMSILENNSAYQNNINYELSEEYAGQKISSNNEELFFIMAQAQESSYYSVYGIFNEDDSVMAFGKIEMEGLLYSDIVKLQTYDVDGNIIEDYETESVELQNLSLILAQDFKEDFQEVRAFSLKSDSGDIIDGIACNALYGLLGSAVSGGIAYILGVSGGPLGITAALGGILIGGTLSYFLCPSANSFKLNNLNNPVF